MRDENVWKQCQKAMDLKSFVYDYKEWCFINIYEFKVIAIL